MLKSKPLISLFLRNIIHDHKMKSILISGDLKVGSRREMELRVCVTVFIFLDLGNLMSNCSVGST
jgi:hypothetical protein